MLAPSRKSADRHEAASRVKAWTRERFSLGAEGDIAAYIVSRIFPVGVFSSVMGFVTTASSSASATGATLLSITLAATGSYNLYLTICGISVFIGSLMFILLKPNRQAQPQPAA